MSQTSLANNDKKPKKIQDQTEGKIGKNRTKKKS
jgi:hypothetical protein